VRCCGFLPTLLLLLLLRVSFAASPLLSVGLPNSPPHPPLPRLSGQCDPTAQKIGGGAGEVGGWGGQRRAAGSRRTRRAGREKNSGRARWAARRVPAARRVARGTS